MRTQPLTGSLCLAGFFLAALAVSGAAGGGDQGKVPALAVKWQRPLLMDKNEFTDEVDPGKDAKVWVTKALTARGDAALVPGSRPLVIGDRVVLRTYDDARVLTLADDKKPNGNKAGGIVWVGAPSEGGLVAILDGPLLRGGKSTFTNLLNQMPPADLAQTILENGLAGALGYDGTRVFWIDNLAVSPPQVVGPGGPKGKKGKVKLGVEQQPEDDLLARREHNILWAIDLKTGRIAWRAGQDEPGKKDPFAQSHFLGVPCRAGERLYMLNETNEGKLRLLALSPATGAIENALALETVASANRFMTDARRQVHAAQVVADSSLLVCVPHAGKVFGVDAAKQSIRWSYTYGIAATNPLGFWKDSPPIIQDGKVVFTAADSEDLHCVGLQDGKSQWKTKQADGLYVAGIVGDNVLVVCNACCRALSIKDGKEVWKVDIGTPSGVGVLEKKTYLVPVKLGAASKTSEIVYLDAERGQVVGTSPLKEIPGNLAIWRDQIVSVSATTVMALGR